MLLLNLAFGGRDKLYFTWNHGMGLEYFLYQSQAACLNGNKSMVQLLVDSGADLWTENEVNNLSYF